MPHVTVEWLTRSIDERRAVIEGITDVLVERGNARREMVNVTFIETTKEIWGRGGKLGIDREDVHP
jgi:4-oxalocrotonate tautomerase